MHRPVSAMYVRPNSALDTNAPGNPGRGRASKPIPPAASVHTATLAARKPVREASRPAKPPNNPATPIAHQQHVTATWRRPASASRELEIVQYGALVIPIR